MKRLLLCLLALTLCMSVSCSSDLTVDLNDSYDPSEWSRNASETVGSAGTEDSIPSQEETSSEDFTIRFDYTDHFAGLVFASEHIAVYDMTLKDTIFSYGDQTEKLFPASVTKLYTAYVALQYLDPAEVLTVGYEGELEKYQPSNSLAWVRPGHQLTVEMLIEGMMLPSGNDAAYVIAANAGRRILNDPDADPFVAAKALVAEMNRQAKEDGMVNTHFVTPDGYHDPNHYTCAQDLIIFAEKAMSCETIMKFTSKATDKVFYKSGQTMTWNNSNQLVNPNTEYYRKEFIGLKTGFTDQAGSCVVAAAKREDGRTVIIVAMGSRERYQQFGDVNACFARYENIEFFI